jgi:hypothetical protein
MGRVAAAMFAVGWGANQRWLGSRPTVGEPAALIFSN